MEFIKNARYSFKALTYIKDNLYSLSFDYVNKNTIYFELYDESEIDTILRLDVNFEYNKEDYIWTDKFGDICAYNINGDIISNVLSVSTYNLINEWNHYSKDNSDISEVIKNIGYSIEDYTYVYDNLYKITFNDLTNTTYYFIVN